SINGSASVSVSAAAADHLVMSAPAAATAGQAVTATVTATDPYGNTDTAYAGILHITSNDGQASLPANSTLTSGVGTFSVTLKTVGSKSIIATDTVTGSITGSASVNVAAANADHLAV